VIHVDSMVSLKADQPHYSYWGF